MVSLSRLLAGRLFSVPLLAAAFCASCSSTHSDSALDICDLGSSISSVGAIDESNTAAENVTVALRVAEIIDSVDTASDDRLATDLGVLASAYRDAAEELQQSGDLATARTILFSQEAVAAAEAVDDSMQTRCHV